MDFLQFMNRQNRTTKKPTKQNKKKTPNKQTTKQIKVQIFRP